MFVTNVPKVRAEVLRPDANETYTKVGEIDVVLQPNANVLVTDDAVEAQPAAFTDVDADVQRGDKLKVGSTTYRVNEVVERRGIVLAHKKLNLRREE